MSKPSIEIEGARELRRALKSVDGGINDLKATHAAAAEIVEKRAATLTPVRTGRLRSSVRSSGQTSGGVVRAGRAAVPYAGVIHFGWVAHNIEPNPYLYDAADERRSAVLDTYAKQIETLKKRHGLD